MQSFLLAQRNNATSKAHWVYPAGKENTEFVDTWSSFLATDLLHHCHKGIIIKAPVAVCKHSNGDLTWEN